jgi:hypothetical protein
MFFSGDGVSGALILDLMWDGKDISEAPKSGFRVRWKDQAQMINT